MFSYIFPEAEVKDLGLRWSNTAVTGGSWQGYYGGLFPLVQETAQVHLIIKKSPKAFTDLTGKRFKIFLRTASRWVFFFLSLSFLVLYKLTGGLNYYPGSDAEVENCVGCSRLQGTR